MRLSMAAKPLALVEPRGKSSTARRWFSNWLVIAPSIVQCPNCGPAEPFRWRAGGLGFEKFNSQYSHIVERHQDFAWRAFGLALKRRVEGRRWSEREPQNAAVVAILDKWVEGNVAVARAHRQDGEFAREGNKSLQDKRRRISKRLRSHSNLRIGERISAISPFTRCTSAEVRRSH